MLANILCSLIRKLYTSLVVKAAAETSTTVKMVVKIITSNNVNPFLLATIYKISDCNIS